MSVNLKVTPEEYALIRKIAQRAEREVFAPNCIPQTQLDTIMDLEATHANGCPINFEQLLLASNIDFEHDLIGIRHHIDRRTGKLEHGFTPRYSACFP